MQKLRLGYLLLCVCAVLPFMCQAAGQTNRYAITRVIVIDPTEGSFRRNMTVFVNGDDIESVVPSSTLQLPAAIRVIPGKGMLVIPGLRGMHTHFRDIDRDLKLYIAIGVLGIRSMGAPSKDVFSVRDAIASGQRLGPKIVASGPIVDGPDSWSNFAFTVSVKTADEERAAIQSLKTQGSDFIKVYDGLSKDTYYAIADETKRLGIPFAGHLPASISVREASNAGQRTVHSSA